MATMTREERLFVETRVLARALKHNHSMESESFAMSNVFPFKEIMRYLNPIENVTQLTLPHRFGMYKTPTKGFNKTTEVELEDPPFNLDSTYSTLANHKVRDIFS